MSDLMLFLLYPCCNHLLDLMDCIYLFIEIYLYRVYTFSKILLLQHGPGNTIQYNTTCISSTHHYK